MARVARRSSQSAFLRNARGAVYVEFLIAFFPVFVLFLATCQLALLTTARMAVSHAAVAAVRSAIVVLYDPAGDYDGAPFGSLSEGRKSEQGAADLARELGSSDYQKGIRSVLRGSTGHRRPQTGARMGPVRLAAAVPLMAVAPSTSSIEPHKSSVERALSSSTGDLVFALAYTYAAAAITLHANEFDDALAPEPLAPTQNVTVRVTYLYRCAIPLVRALMCRSLKDIFGAEAGTQDSPVVARLRAAADIEQLGRWVPETERFTILTGVASLPNQGTLALKEPTQ